MDYVHLNEHMPLLHTNLPRNISISSSRNRPPVTPGRLHKCAGNLPLPLQVTLGLLGLWSPKPGAQSTQAEEEKELTPVVLDIPFMKTDDDKPSVDNKDMPQQNFDDENKCDNDDYDDYDEYSIGHQAEERDRKYFWRSDVFAILYLLTTCCLLTYNFVTYLVFYWGIKQHLLHLVSYFTFLLQVMAIPFWCLYARLLCIIHGRRYRERYPLFRSFLSTRVSVLTSSRFGAKGLSWFRLVCFLALPVTNALLRIINDYTFATCQWQNTYKIVTHWGAFLGYIFYGCFCYLIHIERVSFECEVRQISIFARKQASDNNVGEVRKRISEFFLRYNTLRRLIRMWMAFTMVVATWGLTAHLTWNYLVYSNEDIDRNYLPAIHFLNILVSSQKIMFFAVPCVAIGGLNLDHVWKRFKYEIARNRIEYSQEVYWAIINRYIYDISVDHSGDLTPTLLFSAIGFYLGLNLGNGDQEYLSWAYNNLCNSSHHPRL